MEVPLRNRAAAPALLFSSLVVAGCASEPPAPPLAPPLAPPPAALAAATALRTELKAELDAAMQAGGPEAAITVCSERASAIAARHSQGGVVVGRASHKLRNPKNAAPAWVAPILDEMVRADPKSLAPRTVALPGGAIGYVEPLLTQPLCTSCHGSAIAEPVKEKLRALYPGDQAVGFEPGQLRGVLWARAPAP